MVAEVTTGAVRRVGSLSGMRPAYVPTGHLVYAHRDGILMSVGFDTEALEATSAPVAILPGIYARVIGYGSARFWSAAFDVSSTGALVYGMGVPETPAPLSWLDMEGRETPVPTALPSARSPKISPDGTRIAFEALDQVWIHDVRQGTDMQLTFEGMSESPVWSPDGRFVYFLSERPRTEGFDGFRKPADGGSDAEQLWSASGEVAITSVSPDGGTLVLATQRGPAGPESRDISLFRLDGSGVGEVVEYLASDGEESEGTVSPNGRWLAYFGTGQDVFVRGFPDPVGLWRLSAEGEMRRSYDPVWAPDGSALYYGDAGALSKVEVQTDGPFTLAAKTRLFNWTADPGGPGKVGFDIHPDGDRFVVAETGFFSGASALYVFTDFFEELKRLAPN
jgi:Tol biopolymer transport system component